VSAPAGARLDLTTIMVVINEALTDYLEARIKLAAAFGGLKETARVGVPQFAPGDRPGSLDA
jgi:hypothetical protein